MVVHESVMGLMECPLTLICCGYQMDVHSGRARAWVERCRALIAGVRVHVRAVPAPPRLFDSLCEIACAPTPEAVASVQMHIPLMWYLAFRFFVSRPEVELAGAPGHRLLFA